MKAIRAHRFGGAEVLQLDAVEDPTPGAGEVVVDIRAAGEVGVSGAARSGRRSRCAAPTVCETVTWTVPSEPCAAAARRAAKGCRRQSHEG